MLSYVKYIVIEAGSQRKPVRGCGESLVLSPGHGGVTAGSKAVKADRISLTGTTSPWFN